MRTLEREIVGALLESADGKFLLAKNRPGGVYQDCYVVPGGGLEADETREQGLRREMLEETGIDIGLYPSVLLNDTDTGTQEKTMPDGERVIAHMHFNTYYVKLDKPAAEVPIADNDEIFACQWFDKSELKNLKFSPSTEKILRELKLL
jgi:8-oxo-dGTP pyrophosphatase MutT (NUDIX family)